ncbi:uncharacterized protein N7503_003062 [Penicillium pulvis]|uniref:uncharacterized protein n=1 Tax=Penicillium pulvis TaxID=1562058 RepID=UPI002547B0EC|nr:uncharacterized protein N7503_003062 [Penicillium pulvis]KAJ5805460.1 hypothetical protein N7503_003062 [Penicillium pulvis]
MGGRRDDDEECLPDHESPPPPEEPLDPFDPLELGPFTPSAESRNGRSTNSSAGSAAPATGSTEGPIPDEDGVLSLNPLDEPMTDSSFPDDEPRPGRMDRWGRRERRGFRFQRWLEHADTPGDPCPVQPIEIVADDVVRLCNHEPLDLTLPPNVARDAQRSGLISNVDIKAKFVEVTQPVQAPGQPQQSNNWQLYVTQGILCIYFMFRYRGRRGLHTSEIMAVVYKYLCLGMGSLKSIYYSKVANPSDLRFVARIYQELNLLPTEDEPDRETYLQPQEWRHGSSEYRALLGTYMGRVVVYMILGACPGRFKISRVVTWYTEDEEEDTTILQMRFDLEWISASTPPLEGRSLDLIGKPEYAKRKERMSSRGRPRIANSLGPRAGPRAGLPPARPTLPPVLGTPKAGSVTQRIKLPKAAPGPVTEYGPQQWFLGPPILPNSPEGPRYRQKADDMYIDDPLPKAGAEHPLPLLSESPPEGYREPVHKPRKRAREPALTEPAPGPPAKKTKPTESTEKSRDLPKHKSAQARGERGRFAKKPAPDPPAKQSKKAKVSPDEPKKTTGKREVPNGWERPATRAREAAEKPPVEEPTADPADRTSKTCKRCRQEWPLDQFQSAQCGGPETKTCQQCRTANAKKMVATGRRERPAKAADPAQPSSKKCQSCFKEWPIDQFQPLQTGGPITKSCKQCRDAKRVGVQSRSPLETS